VKNKQDPAATDPTIGRVVIGVANWVVPWGKRTLTRDPVKVVPAEDRGREEVETDVPVGESLRGSKNCWKKEARSFKIVVKGLSWRLKRDPPPYRPFLQKPDQSFSLS